jgi:hypothetical protein
MDRTMDRTWVIPSTMPLITEGGVASAANAGGLPTAAQQEKTKGHKMKTRIGELTGANVKQNVHKHTDTCIILYNPLFKK